MRRRFAQGKDVNLKTRLQGRVSEKIVCVDRWSGHQQPPV